MTDWESRLEADRHTALDRLERLRRDFGSIVDASRDSNADDEHDPEGSTIAFERSQVGALAQQVQSRLAEIDAALIRVRTGDYGRCQRCGRPIPQERLEARPEARTCVTCAG